MDVEDTCASDGKRRSLIIETGEVLGTEKGIGFVGFS